MIGAWIVLIAVVIAFSSAIGGADNGFAGGAGLTVSPDSIKGDELIDEHFGTDERASDTIVIHSESLTVDDLAFQETVNQLTANLAGWQADFAAYPNYYYMKAAGMPEAEQMVSESRHSMIIPITFNEESDEYESRGKDFLDSVTGAGNDAVQVYGVGEISGDETFNTIVEEDLSKDMSVGMPVAAVVLLVVFGALIAAALPLLLAFITIGVATAALVLLSNAMTVDSNANTLVIMIGLAVGVDYALFFLERFREERRHGALKIDAIERAGATAGKAVIFSGLTVILAMMGLFLLPMDLFHGMAVGAVMVVVIAVASAVTLLPAMLRLLGDWTNFPRIGLMRKLKRQDATRVSEFKEEHRGQGLWGRLANRVMRRPGTAFLVSLVVLVLAALPVFTMELGTQTSESLPESQFRDGALILAEDFFAGVNEPLQIVVAGDATSESITSKVNNIVTSLGTDDSFGPATVTVSPDNQLTMIEFATHDDPYASSTGKAIDRLRENLIPTATGGSNLEIYVTGDPAISFDSDQALVERLPYVFAFVLGLSFLLLLVAFRSIVVPIASILLNMLSVGAAYGLTVAVFQHGWGNDLFGVMHTPVITSWIPVFLFCILFGLSMDYHVFLLSRIREHMDHSNDNEESIVVGLQSTGRIITGAALIMVAVFGSFTLGRVAEIQQLGFGLGVAVLIDATIIRTILVPATMKLLGNSNWYWPRVLAWVPNLRIEGNLTPIHLERRAPHNDVPPRTAPIAQPSMSAGGE
jgi:RND superfamily putative drug exporter